MLLIVVLLLLSVFLLAGPSASFAAYTSLISSADFDGIRGDTLTTASGIVSVLMIIVGIGILVRVLR